MPILQLAHTTRMSVTLGCSGFYELVLELKVVTLAEAGAVAVVV